MKGQDSLSPPIERRPIGRTGLAVSVMGLGGAPLGGLFRASSTEDAAETVEAALAAGINHIDVAPQYGLGLAEMRVGASLAALAPRELLLSSKVGRLLVPNQERKALANWPEALSYDMRYDVTPEGIRRSLSDSITRLGGRKPDMLFLHDPNRYASGPELSRLMAEAYRTLAALREEGSVAAIGIGVNAPEPCRMALEVGQWDCFLLASTYSVLRQYDEGLLDRCARDGVSVLVGGPYMSGALAGGTRWRYRPIPTDVAGDLTQLRQLCARHDIPLEAAALQFPLRHPAVASVVVGMRTADEVRQNVGFLRTPISDAFWSDLAADGFVRPTPHPETVQA